MGLITKTNPVGVDIPIQNMQAFMYEKLSRVWGITDADWNCHGRAYRNKTPDGGYIPEVYTGNGDYKEVFYDDTLKALSFFGIGERASYAAGSSTIPAFLIFMVDVSKLKEGVAHRADEEIRLDVERLYGSGKFGFELSGYDTGLDVVFKEYSGYRKDKADKTMDMHPKHCFRLNFNLLYNINDL